MYRYCVRFCPPRCLGIFFAAFGLLFLTASARATVRYVDLASINPEAPYTSWETAATNIQDAVDAAVTGDLILVADGYYAVGSSANVGLNRVNVNKAVTVQSVNGPDTTIIQGFQMPVTLNGNQAIRCVYLASGAMLSGFTLTGGATPTMYSGGGVLCESTNAVVTNCVVSGNISGAGGGGIYSGTVFNCAIAGNTTVVNGGGGVSSNLVLNSIITGNFAKSLSTGWGGGAYAAGLTNCLMYNNTSGTDGGAAYSSTLINCTVANNISYGPDGALSGSVAKNSIIYYNAGRTNLPATGTGHFTNCCFFPAVAGGVNNFTNAPVFMNLAALDFHLNAASPCINAGNNSYVTSKTDLDGNPRVVNGLVDLGAYEFQHTIHYVRTNKHTPTFPYTSWVWAATNIQDAIDAALAGDFIVVSNGVYKTGGRAVYGLATNRVVVNKAVMVESVNGAAVTTIAGARSSGALPNGIRCVYLTSNAVFTGFTLTNGCARTNGNTIAEQSGGGLWCEDNSAMVSNCVVEGSFASQWGGGAFRGTLVDCLLTNNGASFGGGAASNVLEECELINNTNKFYGGGAAYAMLIDCMVMGNRGIGNGSVGGGAYFSTVIGGMVVSNSAGTGGGIAYGNAADLMVSGNQATSSGGGAYFSLMNNCILQQNHASNGGGVGNGTLNNCTIVTNVATVAGGGAFGATLNNCILQFNSCTGSPNYSLGTLNFCCTTPMPANGAGNITNDPALANLPILDFHLQGTSPCINSGNNLYVTTLTDFDGAPRIVGGTVDIGAYEYQVPASVISYAWLEQYGFPLDGTADYADTDGDGASNYLEWIAGTNPLSNKSVFKLLSGGISASGVTLTWFSVTNRNYFIQRADSLDEPVQFETISGNVPGRTNMTTWEDTNVTGTGPYFYRVGVEY